MTAIPVLDGPIERLMELDQESIFAIADIAAERVRQVEGEGWTPEHDDEHDKGELAKAASAYALAGSYDDRARRFYIGEWDNGKHTPVRQLWPWDWKWWKPKSRHRDQVRAGALLVAELARHLRSASR